MIGRKGLVYDAIFTSLGSEYSISGLGYSGTPPLPSRQVNMADLLNEIFIHSEEITPNPENSTQLEFWKLSAKAFGPKIFSRHDSQGIRNDGKRSGFVDRTRP